jgi:hypothetical protein
MNIRNFIPSTLSAKAMMICMFILIAVFLINGFDPFIISWDTYGYYLYLPQGILHQDIGVENFETITHALESQVHTSTFYQASKAETGNWVMKYPMGLSIFYLPFFLIGLFASWAGNYEMNGFSLPFQYSMMIGSVLYMLAGIWLLWKILKHFFSEIVTSITLIFILFGTNYLQIHIGSHCMPHVYLFTAYAALIWLTILWYEKRKIKHAVLIGLLIGLMTISRPTELLSIIIPILYGLKSPISIYHRIKKIGTWYKHILAAGVALCMIILPQLIYWKIFAGNWIYNSYNNPGEGLDILSPNTLDFLFSFRKGWLIYTPIMIFSIIGVFVTKKSKPTWFWPIITFSILYIYVSSCWSSWWYATSFSQRTMVQVYPLLAISFACFIDFVVSYNKKRRLLFLILIFLGALNTFQIWQYSNGIIDPSRMTQRYYWSIFGTTTYDKNLDKFLLVKRSVTDEESFKIFEECYFIDQTYSLTPKNGLYINSNEFKNNSTAIIYPNKPSPKFESKFRNLTLKDHVWIHVTGKLTSSGNLDNLLITNTFTHDGKAYKYKKENIKDYLIPSQNDTTVFHIMYLSPEIRTIDDTYQFYLNNESNNDTIAISDLVMEIYSKKSDCE